MSNLRRNMMAAGRRAAVDWSGLIDGSLSGDIVVPDGITQIKEYAFLGCSGITSVKIPDSVTSIGSTALRIGPNLIRLDVGSGVTFVGQGAFYTNNNRNQVMIFRSVLPPVINSNTFGATGSSSIYVPDESVEAYKAANYWSALADRIKPLSELGGGKRVVINWLCGISAERSAA